MSLSDIYDDLEDHLADSPPADVDGTGQFTISDLGAADWAVRKIARERRKLAQALEVAAAQRKRLDEWETDQRDRAERSTAFLADLLERFHRSELDADPKAKTIRLPSGELVARKQPDTLVWDGGTDTLDWAEENAPNLVVTKKSLDRVAARHRLGMSDTETEEGFAAIDPATGQIVGGCWFRTGDVKFTVKTGEDILL